MLEVDTQLSNSVRSVKYTAPAALHWWTHEADLYWVRDNNRFHQLSIICSDIAAVKQSSQLKILWCGLTLVLSPLTIGAPQEYSIFGLSFLDKICGNLSREWVVFDLIVLWFILSALWFCDCGSIGAGKGEGHISFLVTTTVSKAILSPPPPPIVQYKVSYWHQNRWEVLGLSLLCCLGNGSCLLELVFLSMVPVTFQP